MQRPEQIDVQRDRGLRLVWADGRVSFYPVAHLRRMSPSAEMRTLRQEMRKNPLTVLPSSMAEAGSCDLRIVDAELVGNYAVRLRFSDGHHTGIYSWTYLSRIDPDAGAGRGEP